MNRRTASRVHVLDRGPYNVLSASLWCLFDSVFRLNGEYSADRHLPMFLNATLKYTS